MIRASLSEFIALEDYISSTHNGVARDRHKIYKTSDPILHMIKLLRNYNIHISNNECNNKSMEVMIPNFPENTLVIQVPYISNLQLEDLQLVRDARFYSDAMLRKMIDCFNHEQNKYGIDTLIIKAALQYGEKLRIAIFQFS